VSLATVFERASQAVPFLSVPMILIFCVDGFSERYFKYMSTYYLKKRDIILTNESSIYLTKIQKKFLCFQK
jgi:hypothetical protein